MSNLPDFMGVATQNDGRPVIAYIPFFMTILKNEEGTISGTIEDTLGSAEFIGKLTEEDIWFEKRYLNAARPRDKSEAPYFASTQPITYKGALFEGAYHGTFSILNLGAGEFILERYASSPTLDAIYEQIKSGELRIRTPGDNASPSIWKPSI